MRKERDTKETKEQQTNTGIYRIRMDDGGLTEIFSQAGRKYGYTEVQAHFLPLKDLKVRWSRSASGWAMFEVSDYLADAPREALEGLAENIFERMAGMASAFCGDLKKWLTRPEFSLENQTTYLDRCRNVTRSPVGEHRDLRDSLERLKARGLDVDIPNLYLSWTSSPRRDAGCSSVLMKVVGVNSALDSEDVPEEVLDFCLYSILARVGMGYRPEGDDPEEYGRRIERFGGYSEAKEIAEENGIAV